MRAAALALLLAAALRCDAQHVFALHRRSSSPHPAAADAQLASSGALPLLPDSPVFTEFYTFISIGGANYSVQVDTGSALLAVAAPGVPARRSYSPAQSRWSHVVQRAAAECMSDERAYAPACGFRVTYLDQSFISGPLAVDVAAVAPASAARPVAAALPGATAALRFGIIQERSASFSLNSVDGIFGLATSALSPAFGRSAWDSLTMSGAVGRGMSFCMDAHGGQMILGGRDGDGAWFQGPLLSVPLVPGSPYYAIRLAQLLTRPPGDNSSSYDRVAVSDAATLGGRDGCVIDTGTTQFAISSPARDALRAAFAAAYPGVRGIGDCATGGLCIFDAPLTLTAADMAQYPQLVVEARGKDDAPVRLALQPSEYLEPIGSGLFRMGVVGLGGGQCLLGDRFLQAYYTEIDLGDAGGATARFARKRDACRAPLARLEPFAPDTGLRLACQLAASLAALCSISLLCALVAQLAAAGSGVVPGRARPAVTRLHAHGPCSRLLACVSCCRTTVHAARGGMGESEGARESLLAAAHAGRSGSSSSGALRGRTAYAYVAGVNDEDQAMAGDEGPSLAHPAQELGSRVAPRSSRSASSLLRTSGGGGGGGGGGSGARPNALEGSEATLPSARMLSIGWSAAQADAVAALHSQLTGVQPGARAAGTAPGSPRAVTVRRAGAMGAADTAADRSRGAAATAAVPSAMSGSVPSTGGRLPNSASSTSLFPPSFNPMDPLSDDRSDASSTPPVGGWSLGDGGAFGYTRGTL